MSKDVFYKYWLLFLNDIKPRVLRAKQQVAGEEVLFCFVEGTGHRLSYQREEDWIEITW